MDGVNGAVVGSDTMVEQIRRVRDDDSIKAIVLRVDSPGGSVTGSETIWREVNRVCDGGKPVVVSMGAVAASGGYYVSMAADAIVANPGTITGSIGVVTGKLVARELKDRIGVGSDSVRTNPNADAWSVNAPFTHARNRSVGRGRNGSSCASSSRPAGSCTVPRDTRQRCVKTYLSRASASVPYIEKH